MHKHGGDIYRNVDVLDYSANINPIGIPQSVIDAAIEGIKSSTHYPDVECQELRAAIAEAEGLPYDYIRCGNGAADVIFSFVLAEKPKKALLLAPSFYEYEQALRAVDCEIEYFILEEDKNFEPDEALLDMINPDLDVLFVCNPNNPTGVLLKTSYLDKLLNKCDSCGVRLVLDECFNDFLEKPEEYSMVSRLETSDNLFILKAFTKIYAIPGLRLGYGLTGNKRILERMAEVSQPWSVSVPAQKAGLAALKEMEFVVITREKILREKVYLVNEMMKLGIKVFGYGANYIFFKTRETFGEECLVKKLMIRDCSNYVSLSKGYYRIAVRNHEDNMKLLQIFTEVLNG